ncbi:hypothetical protein R1flu_004058 [Riccia fluitans]|uniref:Uncharacterized protein n=1 Tax=Riccia fluitans TaxID=41844 RepID=A0ABD1YQ62_9MARC
MATKSFFAADVLEGKVALLTGGGSGIGLEIATYFGKDEAKVSLMGRRKEVLDEAVKKLGAQDIKAIGVQGDEISCVLLKTSLPMPSKLNFYEDIFEELGKYGELESLNVCDNLTDHMVGNVYVQFREEEQEQVAAAFQADILTNGR